MAVPGEAANESRVEQQLAHANELLDAARARVEQSRAFAQTAIRALERLSRRISVEAWAVVALAFLGPTVTLLFIQLPPLSGLYEWLGRDPLRRSLGAALCALLGVGGYRMRRASRALYGGVEISVASATVMLTLGEQKPTGVVSLALTGATDLTVRGLDNLFGGLKEKIASLENAKDAALARLADDQAEVDALHARLRVALGSISEPRRGLLGSLPVDPRDDTGPRVRKE